MEESIKS